MKADRHLTEEALILLTTGDCSEEFRQEATGHLQSCPRCRHDCEQVRRIFGAMEQASESGLLSVPPEHRRRSLFDWKKSAFPWVPIGSILGSSLLLILAVLGPFTARTASASELLDRAVLNERHFGTPHAFDIAVNGVKCGRSKSGSEILLLESAAACERVSASIKGTPWGIGDPLAASTFRAWHASLANHHDTVTKLPALWTIDTSTSGGTVRNARITLRTDTYHPVKLDLHFNDEEDVTIEEDDQPFADAPLTAVQTRPQAHQIQTSSPADLLEIEAWQLLHNLNGDTGWEATVAHRGESVVVEAEGLSTARIQEYKTAFAPYPKIELDAREYGDLNAISDFLPRRANEPGGAPPLAEKWLEENFPDSGERSLFVNSTVKLSKAILGRAYVLEELKKRRAALSSCSCARALDSIIEAQKTDLLAERELLRSSLGPVLGSAQQTAPRNITIAAAQRLDVGLVRLFFTAPMSGTTTLDDEENVVRKLQ